MRRFTLLATSALVLELVFAAPVGAQTHDYDDVVLASAISSHGLFTVHQLEDDLLFEIPDAVLGREMIVMSRFGAAQQGLATGGSNLARNNIVVRWERRGDRILLRAVSHQNVAEDGSSVAMAVEYSNFPPVLASFDIEARGDGTSVIEVTDLYLDDTPPFSLPRARRRQLEIRSHYPDRSWLEWARAFPTNVEVRAVNTYSASDAPSNSRGETVSYEVNHSMVLLPEESMMPRLYDERTGLISMGVTDYSRPFQGVRGQRYLIRYRLVDPLKPWVWHIDPATPPELVPYIRAGLLEWKRGLRARRLQERDPGTLGADRDGRPGVFAPRRALLGGALQRLADPVGERRGGRGGPALRRGDPRPHEHLPRACRAHAVAADLAGSICQPAVSHRRALARGSWRSDPLCRVSRDRPRGGAATQPACQFRLSRRVAPRRRVRARARSLGLIGRTHALQLRGAGGRRRASRAPHRRVGQVCGDVGIPTDSGGNEPGGGAGDPQSVDRRARRRALVPVRRGTVRYGYRVGPAPDDGGHLGRSRTSSGLRDAQPAGGFGEPVGVGARRR